MLEKKGQVWIETVIYTLIGITIIAVVLAIVTPQINKTKDKNLIEQTLNAMNILSDSISEVEQTGAGNIRVVEFRVAKGRLEIDGLNNKIVYILEDTKLELSEVGQSISEGNVDILTEKKRV
jgi:type II secretory pathway pseudopilin PulG